jgi:hypothetical protein
VGAWPWGVDGGDGRDPVRRAEATTTRAIRLGGGASPHKSERRACLSGRPANQQQTHHESARDGVIQGEEADEGGDRVEGRGGEQDRAGGGAGGEEMDGRGAEWSGVE